jgi:hypothetical protein
MRRPVNRSRLAEFSRALAAAAKSPGRVYLTGGATALLFGWRESTRDVDVKFDPEQDELLRAIPAIKESLQINVELASPDQFIPTPEWRERSRFIEIHGLLSFYHFDLCSQALAKIERGHEKDRVDVAAMLERGLVTPDELRLRFEEIEPLLYRYPAVDPGSFRSAVEAATASGV